MVRAFSDVEAYFDWRRANRRDGNAKRRKLKESQAAPTLAPLSARSIAKDRQVLHQVFALADRREYVNDNAVTKTEKPADDERDPIILTAEQYEAFIAAATVPILRTYVILLGESGIRCKSEALWLRWEDINLEEGTLRIASGRDGHRTKSGKSRWVPITPRLSTALKEHLAAYRFTGSPWVFHHRINHGKRKQNSRINSLSHGFTAAARRAELPKGLHLHDLRHRRVTLWMARARTR